MRGSGVGGGATPAHGTHTRVSGVRPHSSTFHLSFELDEITRGVLMSPGNENLDTSVGFRAIADSEIQKTEKL